VWPAANDTLRTDDWLRLVFTHEFTHIVHLDRSRGWARPVRALFGRVPIAFPNMFLPTWQVEGIATYEESVLTGEGRLHAGDFLAITTEAARAHRMEPIDRANGALTRWPGGRAPYAYGLGFHAYLGARFGDDTLGPLADATAGRLPYLGSGAFKKIYGQSLGALWREYEQALIAAQPGVTDGGSAATRLTFHRYVVSGPRVAPPACPSCAPELYYAVRNADEFPGLYRLRLDGSRAAEPERVALRYLGSTLGATPAKIYFDQQEVRRNAGLYSDLYVLDRKTGRVKAVTNGRRLMDPDVAADGRRLAAVEVLPGRRDLVIVALSAGARTSSVSTIAGDPDTQFNAPRWSPDGRRLVAQRQQRGGQPELVIVTVDRPDVRPIASGGGWRWVTPTWRPDGRAIVAAGAKGDDPFNLYEIDIESSRTRQLTRSTGGATWPEVTPDGSSIVYVGYSVDGFDLYRIPYPSAGAPVDSMRAIQEALRPPAEDQSVAAAAPLYRPWATLPPTSWFPVLYSRDDQTFVGASIAGADVLGYHGYFAQVAARVSDAGVALPTAASPPRLDWDVSYAYTRWRPVLFASASSKTYLDLFVETDARVRNVRHEQEREAGVVVPIVHARLTQTALASFVRLTDDVTTVKGTTASSRLAVRSGWSVVSAHEFGNSISRERGTALGVTIEADRSTGGADHAATLTLDARAYVPAGPPHHVVAARFAIGGTTGAQRIVAPFTLGGPAASGSVLDFDAHALSLLRGFDDPTFAGSRVAVANVDYRFPLLRIERGHGTWPFFIHTIHAALFGDAGQTWSTHVTAHDLKTSFGAEISANLVIGYVGALTTTAGAARIHDGAGLVADDTRAFFRVGYAF